MARIAIVGPVRSRFRAALGRLEGHQLVAQPTLAKQALDHLDADQFDLLVVMQELSDIHGLELITMLKESGQLGAATPVLLCSSLNTALNIQRAMRFGASGFLLASDGPVLITHVINSVLQGGAIFPEYEHLQLEDVRLRHALNFSPQHVAVLYGLQRGHLSESMAAWLRISNETIRRHKRYMMHKLGVSSLQELIAITREIGLT